MKSFFINYHVIACRDKDCPVFMGRLLFLWEGDLLFRFFPIFGKSLRVEAFLRKLESHFIFRKKYLTSHGYHAIVE